MKKAVYKKNNILLYWLYIFFVMSIFEVPYLTANFPIMDTIYLLLQVLSGFIIFILTLKRKTLSKIDIYLLAFCLVLFLSTFINNGNIVGSIKQIVKIMTIALFLEYGIKEKKEITFRAIASYFRFLIILNLISVIVYPNGMYVTSLNYTDNWILGYRNLHILYVMIGLLFDYLVSYTENKKLRLNNYILLLLSTISLFLVDSGTSKIGILVIVLYSITKIFDRKIFNINNYGLTYIFLCISIVLLRLQNIFKYLIVDILHRDITFTGRVYIWDYILEFIKQKPLLGYGKEFAEYRLHKTLYWLSSHAHNLILEIIYQTGFLGLISFMFIVFTSFKKLYKHRENEISKLIAIFIFAYMIMLLTEFYQFEFILYILVLGYNVTYLIGGESHE